MNKKIKNCCIVGYGAIGPTHAEALSSIESACVYGICDIEKERAVLRAQALNEGKPEKIVDKMVEGRIAKFYENYCLLEQPFVKDNDKKVVDVLNGLIATIGEKITVRRFVRYEKGEGLAKKEENFAEEVQKQLQ